MHLLRLILSQAATQPSRRLLVPLHLDLIYRPPLHQQLRLRFRHHHQSNAEFQLPTRTMRLGARLISWEILFRTAKGEVAPCRLCLALAASSFRATWAPTTRGDLGLLHLHRCQATWAQMILAGRAVEVLVLLLLALLIPIVSAVTRTHRKRRRKALE